jgi:transposase
MAQGKTDRNHPKRAPSSESRYSLMEFRREFPDDATCMEYLVQKLYPEGIFCPKDGRVTKHHRLTNRPAYSCQFCGRHEYPLKGTIFQGSSTSLHLWFEAMYMMASTRCGISAKQLERETGVTYPTAWRMFKLIRSLLDQDGDDFFSGTVEMDEAYIGGRVSWRHQSQKVKAGLKTGRPPKNDPFKTPVFGIVQRGSDGQAGKVMAKVIDQPGGRMLDHARSKVKPGSTVYTDEWMLYRTLADMYTHGTVDHSKKVYVSGDVHIQSIEGFWSLVKRGISGVYHGVSPEHLQSYVDEYVFRYNNRDLRGRGVFDAFLSRIRKEPRPA